VAEGYGERVGKQRIIGLFETEQFTRDGERLGPMILWDSEQGRERGETEWLTETSARELARERGWRFRVDQRVLDDPLRKLNLEYFEDLGAQLPRVLLLFGASQTEIEALRSEVASLAGVGGTNEFWLDQPPGLSDVDGCSLVARVGESDLGVERIGGEALEFRCVLTPSGWRRVVDLLEPFLVNARDTRFQYLTEVGSVEWIISTDRSW
jgi:hypothetical protein